jgi:hypothetical protein
VRLAERLEERVVVEAGLLRVGVGVRVGVGARLRVGLLTHVLTHALTHSLTHRVGRFSGRVPLAQLGTRALIRSVDPGAEHAEHLGPWICMLVFMFMFMFMFMFIFMFMFMCMCMCYSGQAAHPRVRRAGERGRESAG